MKRNQFSLLAIIAACSLMTCSPMLRAQDTTTPPPAAQGADTPTAPPPARGTALRDTLAKLDLTPDQKQKVNAALKERRDKMSALQEDASLTPQERRPKIKEITDASEAKLKTIMTPEQYAKWQTARPRMARPGDGQGASASQGGTAGTNSVSAPKTEAPQN